MYVRVDTIKIADQKFQVDLTLFALLDTLLLCNGYLFVGFYWTVVISIRFFFYQNVLFHDSQG